MFEIREFIFKFMAPNTLATRSITFWITPLNHEPNMSMHPTGGRTTLE